MHAPRFALWVSQSPTLRPVGFTNLWVPIPIHTCHQGVLLSPKTIEGCPSRSDSFEKGSQFNGTDEFRHPRDDLALLCVAAIQGAMIIAGAKRDAAPIFATARVLGTLIENRA
jgi:hypothetical protein